MTGLPNLEDLWKLGVDAVKGDRAVAHHLAAHPIAPPTDIIAIGKAASAMARAACTMFPNVPSLIVTKYGHTAGAPPGADVIEAAHPVPDAQSLIAGQTLRARIADSAPGAHLLLLVSGGASALAEALPAHVTLDDLARETQTLLASGADIHAINARRKDISLIKGGKLLQDFKGARVTTLAISDVEGDSLSVIGSGIGDALHPAPFAFAPHIIASNAVARAAIAAATPEILQVNAETLYENVEILAPRIAHDLQNGPPGLYLYGGEPTVILPDTPGKGGRNMALGLTISSHLKGLQVDLLVAGTDGTDGPTDAAGAFVTGETWQDTARDALAQADAYPWLKRHNALFTSGPTGTNVMDLLLARKY